jgi:sulfite reductase (NADPH) hemoprotein beta-component
MNACGHHHVGNIGILGVDKKGEEFYQVSIGGSAYANAALAQILGPSFARSEIPEVVDKLVTLYVEKREDGEHFVETFNRVGIKPFKERVYAN